MKKKVNIYAIKKLKEKFLLENSVIKYYENYTVIWINKINIKKCLKTLKLINKPYNMLYDLYGVDERFRINKKNMPNSDFTINYHVISILRNDDILFKVPLLMKDLSLKSITSIFKNSNWYEREIWDMFGINFIGHPNLTRIIMPKYWKGHPLRKDHKLKFTKFEFNEEENNLIIDSLNYKIFNNDKENIILNVGPNHPSVHGVFRIILKLYGEKILDCIPEIGFHHRGVEKIGENKTWHNYIPYTDRVEYLGGCINEMPYVISLEKLANIKVPEKAKVIRIMLSELFRINSHLVYISTYIQDIGGMTPVFLAFVDRQKIYDIIECITGARMHPAWFRIGGVAKDLPNNWHKLLKNFLKWIPERISKYVNMSVKNSILKSRSIGVASYNSKEAIEWGVTGSSLRATGINFDVRKNRPYSGYENFEFDIPLGNGTSDCYNRLLLKIEEIYQSIKILNQCLNNMPEGPYKSDDSLSTPQDKKNTLNNIETLINHFLQMSWGPVIPFGESFQMVEATKGINSYYIISDNSTKSYRTRIRTPSFAHLQQIPSVIKGHFISDLITYLGSIDFVMSDVDR
ncbi:MAG: NADH-quinone oxidoreductase subunit C/D [Enterobacteriaceae bacterium]